MDPEIAVTKIMTTTMPMMVKMFILLYSRCLIVAQACLHALWVIATAYIPNNRLLQRVERARG
jgi:hypothetical protein